ncbi:hypothetical protein GCM10009535_49270 [Streptomyces thermocarboxydovorans]|uniref:Acyl-CoA dehydrogenase n=1 Tax=Streptomyces thermocarboxydovorans TaxID=59298 RepID=A0ABP3SWV9_9ACTN
MDAVAFPSVDLARRTAEFVRKVAIPAEEECGGVSAAGGEAPRTRLREAARSAACSPPVLPEFGGHGLDLRGRH